MRTNSFTSKLVYDGTVNGLISALPKTCQEKGKLSCTSQCQGPVDFDAIDIKRHMCLGEVCLFDSAFFPIVQSVSQDQSRSVCSQTEKLSK